MFSFAQIKNYLWKPFEFFSNHSCEKVEAELASRIIKEPTFHLLPYYDKPYGEVFNGKFKISFAPLSSLVMRGAGTVTISGHIKNNGKGSRIYGRLPGPAVAVWVVAVIAFGFDIAA